MKNQNQNQTQRKESNWKSFLSVAKELKTLDSTNWDAHKLRVINLINAKNQELAQFYPIKNWLSVLSSKDFKPTRTRSGKFSIHFTLVSLRRELEKQTK